MSKMEFSAQVGKPKSLVDSARLQAFPSAITVTASPQPNEDVKEVSDCPVATRARAKDLKAIPLLYLEAHAELKATSKIFLDFSSYAIKTIRRKLERDGAIGQ